MDGVGKTVVPGIAKGRRGSKRLLGRRNRLRTALSLNREQTDGFTTAWEYCGHTGKVRSLCMTGEGRRGRMRITSMDAWGIHSYEERDSGVLVAPFPAMDRNVINYIVFVPPHDVFVASSMDTSVRVYDRGTLRTLAVLSTKKIALLFLAYNSVTDEIISGDSEGCHTWRLSPSKSRTGGNSRVPYSLTLLRGFKGSSGWMSKMVFNESAQLVLVLNGDTVSTFNVATGGQTYRIVNAHTMPLTACMWYKESQHIITGCSKGVIKVWACHHNAWLTMGKMQRRGRRKVAQGQGEGRKGKARRRIGQPALLKTFHKHSLAVTDIAPHGMDQSLVVSSSLDSTLRIWDIERLCPMAVVPVSIPVASLQSHACRDGRVMVVCTNQNGCVSILQVRSVCSILGPAMQGVMRMSYIHGRHIGEVACAGHASLENRCGMFLAETDQGLWGIIDEALLLGQNSHWHGSSATMADSVFEAGYLVAEDSKPESTRDESRSAGDQAKIGEGGGERGGGGGGEGEFGKTPAKGAHQRIFSAWAPLSSISENLSHHVLVPKHDSVVSITDSGLLVVYRFCRGRATRVGARRLRLPMPKEKVTCMALVEETPPVRKYTLSHLRSACFKNNMEMFSKGDGDSDSQKTVWGRLGESTVAVEREGKDGVLAVGTSHGGILLVESCVKGMTLACLEGLFRGPILSLCCLWSTIDGSDKGGDSIASRLVCLGGDHSEGLEVKGLSLPSLVPAFSLELNDRPTCFVGDNQAIIGLGYSDGTVQLLDVRGNRVNHIESPDLTGEHGCTIVAIAFSDLYCFVATGSKDGSLKIWNREGDLQQTVHLQEAPRAIVFADVAGDILISFPSRIVRIGIEHWRPSCLLATVKRCRSGVGLSKTEQAMGVLTQEEQDKESGEEEGEEEEEEEGGEEEEEEEEEQADRMKSTRENDCVGEGGRSIEGGTGEGHGCAECTNIEAQCCREIHVQNLGETGRSTAEQKITGEKGFSPNLCRPRMQRGVAAPVGVPPPVLPQTFSILDHMITKVLQGSSPPPPNKRTRSGEERPNSKGDTPSDTLSGESDCESARRAQPTMIRDISDCAHHPGPRQDPHTHVHPKILSASQESPEVHLNDESHQWREGFVPNLKINHKTRESCPPNCNLLRSAKTVFPDQVCTASGSKRDCQPPQVSPRRRESVSSRTQSMSVGQSVASKTWVQNAATLVAATSISKPSLKIAEPTLSGGEAADGLPASSHGSVLSHQAHVPDSSTLEALNVKGRSNPRWASHLQAIRRILPTSSARKSSQQAIVFPSSKTVGGGPSNRPKMLSSGNETGTKAPARGTKDELQWVSKAVSSNVRSEFTTNLFRILGQGEWSAPLHISSLTPTVKGVSSETGGVVACLTNTSGKGDLCMNVPPLCPPSPPFADRRDKEYGMSSFTAMEQCNDGRIPDLDQVPFVSSNSDAFLLKRAGLEGDRGHYGLGSTLENGPLDEEGDAGRQLVMEQLKWQVPSKAILTSSGQFVSPIHSAVPSTVADDAHSTEQTRRAAVVVSSHQLSITSRRKGSDVMSPQKSVEISGGSNGENLLGGVTFFPARPLNQRLGGNGPGRQRRLRGWAGLRPS